MPPPSTPTRAGWFARWLGHNRQTPKGDGFAWLDSSDTPFTPENLPGISPEACAFFNTPTEEVDPEAMRIVLAVFVMYLADRLPPELGVDREALFAMLWERLGPLAGTGCPDASPAEQANLSPACPADAAPDAPAVLPAETPDAAPADDTVIPAAAAGETAPDAAPPAVPWFHCVPCDRGPSSRHRRLVPARPRRSRPRRPWPAARQAPLPQRLYYAACAGPP